MTPTEDQGNVGPKVVSNDSQSSPPEAPGSGTEPSAAPTSGAPEIAALLEEMRALRSDLAAKLGEVAGLREDFAAKLRYDTAKDRQIDQLHQQLQEQKQDLYSKMMRPVFNDLIGLQDSLYGLLKHAPAPETPSDSEARLRSSVVAVADVIESTLDRYGVTAYMEEGDAFSGQRQRAERAVETDDPARDRQVAERLRKGFLYNGRVLRPELVATYRLKR